MFSHDKHVDSQLNKAVEKLLKAEKSDGIIPIVSAGEPVLRVKSEKYAGQLTHKTMAKLIAAMRATMLAAPGVGLAAPQIGIPLAFAVVEDHARSDGEDDSNSADVENVEESDPREIAEFPFHAIINPIYEPLGTQTASFYEGCLSVPGFQAVRRRWLNITARWFDELGNKHEQKLHGWPARIFQHETDHLSGELYIDKAQLRSLSTDTNLDEYWWEPVPFQAAKTLGFEI